MAIFAAILPALISAGASIAASRMARKKGQDQSQLIQGTRPVFTGRRPFGSPLSEADTASLAQRFAGQIGERSQGQGLVGFDPRRRDVLRNEFLQDFGDYRTDVLNRASQQASGQGFRGGLPLEARNEAEKSLARARQAALSNIDVEDLQARREDINKATYAQPDLARQSAATQAIAAQFDLDRARFEEPAETLALPEEDTSGSSLGAMIAALVAQQGLGSDLGALSQAVSKRIPMRALPADNYLPGPQRFQRRPF